MAVHETHANFAEPVRSMGSVEQFALAKQVQEVMAHPGWEALLALVGEQRARLDRQLLNPSLPSIEKFASLTGEIRGLNAMVNAAETVLAVAAETETRLNESLAESS